MYQHYPGASNYANYGGNSGMPVPGARSTSEFRAHNDYYSSPSGAVRSPSHGNNSSVMSSTHTPQSGIMAKLNETSAVAILQHLDKDELQGLLDDDSKLQNLVDDLPQVKDIQTEHGDLVATNKSLAEYNLSLQPRLEDLKQTVAAGYEKVNQMKTDLAREKTRLDSYVGRQSLDTLLALMQTETAKSEEDSEELADKFCDKSLEMEVFLTDYLPKRTIAHLRRIKSERLADLIRDSLRGNSSLGQGQAVHGGSSNSSWGSTSHQPRPPYPDAAGSSYSTSNFGMPQPNMYPH